MWKKLAIALAALILTATFPATALAAAKPASIHGSAYYDFNGNGILDDGESYVSGHVTATLTRPDGTGTVTVEPTGAFYSFDGLKPGAYVVKLDVAPQEWTEWRYMDGGGGDILVDMSFYPVTPDPFTIVVKPGETAVRNVGFLYTIHEWF